jgi:monoamine oxidase
VLPVSSSIDVVVIGAGAAGIAATRRLKAAGVAVVMIEARGRLGGRAHTLATPLAPIDMGCEWLHSADRNPLVGIAQKLGFAIETEKPNWGSHAGRGFSDGEQAAFRAASDEFWEALEKAHEDGFADRPAASYLPPGGRWNGLIQTISTYYNGVELEHVSVVDLGRYEDTGVNWRVVEGYGAMIAAAGADLPVAFDCAATRIDHSGARVKVETTQGTIEAKAVIVTLPTSLLAAEAVRFFPSLPEKIDAAQALPLGLADKIFFEIIGETGLPKDGHAFGTTDRVETISFDIRPRGLPLIEGFVGGAFARDLEKQGAKAQEAEARAQFVNAFGADISKCLRFLDSTTWDLDPFSRGAYSHALPGCADMREKLASPVDGRIFFAGEACSRHRFSTAHGAWETGIAAAEGYLGSARVRA